MSDVATVSAAWAWPTEPRLRALAGGLINETWVVALDATPAAVLQRLNTQVFSAVVHEDIEAVTEHLAARGVVTPRLQRTRAGRLWHETPSGDVFRLLTYVGDATIEKATRGAEVREAGALVARFHAATADLRWDFRSVRGGFHDTDLRMEQLDRALDGHVHHRLRTAVGAVADELRARWAAWSGPRALPERVIHGDLKISNVRFRGGRAEALIDLDTLGRGTLDAELGDAFRSWCNPAREDEPARFDTDLFAAGIAGYASQAVGVTREEWDAIVPGVERITLELAARFAADALHESYFGFDAARYATRGEHNLVRARSQLALAVAVADARATAERLVSAARAG